MLQRFFQVSFLFLVLMAGASHAGSRGQGKKLHQHEAINDDLKTAKEGLLILAGKLGEQNQIVLRLIEDIQSRIAEIKALVAEDSSPEETQRIIQRRKALATEVHRLNARIPAEEEKLDNLDSALSREKERVKALERALQKK